jgi:hypothetical protein
LGSGKPEVLAIAASASEQTEELVHESEVVYGYGELDMAAVAGTAK